MKHQITITTATPKQYDSLVNDYRKEGYKYTEYFHGLGVLEDNETRIIISIVH